jgi:hypothetical protein
VAWLEAKTGVRAVTELPNLLEAALPITRVTCIGGVDDKITDTARITVESFAALRPDARDQAETARAWMLDLAHVQVATGTDRWVIDTVETLARPTWADYANDRVHRFIATYELTSRVRVS